MRVFLMNVAEWTFSILSVLMELLHLIFFSYMWYYFRACQETPKLREIIRHSFWPWNADAAEPVGLLQREINYAYLPPSALECKCPVVIHRGIIHVASVLIWLLFQQASLCPSTITHHSPASVIDFLFKIPRAMAGMQVLLLETVANQWHGAMWDFPWGMMNAKIVC